MVEAPQPVGTVASLWRFPVKSMNGERLQRAQLTPSGLRGDRAYALIDVESGNVVSAKSVKKFPELFRCRASFVEPPETDGELPPVRIELPGGSTVDSDAGDVDRVLSDAFGRDVTLALSAPAGAFMDAFPLSVITTATLERLGELRPESRFDERRFRMNVTVRTERSGFVENDWPGRRLTIGDDVRLQVAQADARCVMTTLAVDDLPMDADVLRTLARHNRLEIPGAGSLPCAGVYAVVVGDGVIEVGDEVTVG